MVMLQVASWKDCFLSPFYFSLALQNMPLGLVCGDPRTAWRYHPQPTLLSERLLEAMPGAETRAEHVLGNPSSREEQHVMNGFKHHETVAEAGAKLLPCLLAQVILAKLGGVKVCSCSSCLFGVLLFFFCLAFNLIEN